MKPVNIDQIGEELAIRWEDGTEQFVPLKDLRQHCPCAGCKGEIDIMGNVYKNPEKPLQPNSYQLRALNRIGSYAIQPVWADGHSSGIFSFEYLRNLSSHSENK